MRHLLATTLALVLLFVPWVSVTYPGHVDLVLTAIEQAGSQLAAVIIHHDPKTVEGLRGDYTVAPRQKKTVKILIVPGHEPDFGGAEYGALKERDMNVVVANDLARFLETSKKYEVHVARDASSWSPTLKEYFEQEWDDIARWRDVHREENTTLMRMGERSWLPPDVLHLNAAPNVALRLHGLNKWANEHDVDIVLHLHFNDNPRRNAAAPGKYSGFAVYIPERQYGNSSTTRAVAESIHNRLARYNPVSNYPPEQTGFVEDQELIAIGVFNSVNAASMLIEYAYIYEPQFAHPEIRSLALRDLAYQTYLGIQDFFDPTVTERASYAYDTLMLPYTFDTSLALATANSSAGFALQSALVREGIYPPPGKSKNDCPRTGRIGPCTTQALEEFKKKYGIVDEVEPIGAKTIEQLNKLYAPNGGGR